MKIHDEGRILELDPDKNYWMFVKAGSFLARSIKTHGASIKNGQISFVGDFNDFMFVENTDKVKGITLEISEDKGL